MFVTDCWNDSMDFLNLDLLFAVVQIFVFVVAQHTKCTNKYNPINLYFVCGLCHCLVFLCYNAYNNLKRYNNFNANYPLLFVYLKKQGVLFFLPSITVKFVVIMPFWSFKKGKKDKEPENEEKKKEPADVNDNIEKKLSKAKQEERRTVTLLLLGAGGCGKNGVMDKHIGTLFKQMQNIYNGETSQKELQVTTMAIRKQVFDDIIDLCQTNKELSAKEKAYQIEDEKCCHVRDELAALANKATDEMEFTNAFAQNIKLLWGL
ncbi:GTP-binding regulatory protein Gs alpha-S chain, partial [Reticulomyxa filosa]